MFLFYLCSELEDDVKLLKHLTNENIIDGFARCLNLINPSLNISTQLPPSLSERFKLGALIANAIKVINSFFLNSQFFH